MYLSPLTVAQVRRKKSVARPDRGVGVSADRGRGIPFDRTRSKRFQLFSFGFSRVSNLKLTFIDGGDGGGDSGDSGDGGVVVVMVMVMVRERAV